MVALCKMMKATRSAYYACLLKVSQPAREHMRNDVTVYMRYYNLERLHTANGVFWSNPIGHLILR